MNGSAHTVLSSNDEQHLTELLAAALERLDTGQTVDLDSLCADRHDLVPALAAALGQHSGLQALHAADRAVPAATGRVLAGRYRLDEAIGRGAAGTVFRAHDLRLARDVAVKVLHHGLLASQPAAARFQREAEVLANHEHQHIVRVYDQGQAEDGSLFLVTELLRGRSLHAVLEASRVEMAGGPTATGFAGTAWLSALLPRAQLEQTYLRQVAVWIVQLAEGLAAAHANGVFHRDVKPSNVFVREDGTAVLLDFGIAARAGDPAMTLSQTIVGTPSYMAPEQAVGRVEPNATIDVYGLGATLYHLLTLRPPHTGDLPTVLAAVRTEEPTPAALVHQGLPRDLQAILDHGLERAPAHRYPDMAALAADLRAFLGHRPVSVRPIGTWRRAFRSCRRQPARALAGLLGVAVLVLVIVLAPLGVAFSANAARNERAKLLAHLPGDLCIEGSPDERLLVPLGERAVVLAELDRLLEIEPGDLMVRMLRAAERLDAGEAAAASSDFAELQRLAEGEHLRAVAARYAAAGASGGSSLTVDLSDLPAPATNSDRFVAGFHAMRRHDFDTAYQLLTECMDFVPARDLRLLAACGKKQPEAEALLAEAGWLEGHYGQKTARTRHAMAVAMLVLRRHDAAISYCEDSLRLRPDRHGPWNNLAFAHLRSGNLAEAKRCFERAVALRPWFANSLGGLAQTLRQLDDHEGALRMAASIRDPCWREHELGNIKAAMSMVASARGDDAQRLAHATAAIEHFRAALAVPAEVTRNPGRRALPSAIALAEALGSPEPMVATLAFLRQLQRDPQNARQLANLADRLSRHPLDETCRDELRLLLLELSVSLAPGDSHMRGRRDLLREELHPTSR